MILHELFTYYTKNCMVVIVDPRTYYSRPAHMFTTSARAS